MISLLGYFFVQAVAAVLSWTGLALSSEAERVEDQNRTNQINGLNMGSRTGGVQITSFGIVEVIPVAPTVLDPVLTDQFYFPTQEIQTQDDRLGWGQFPDLIVSSLINTVNVQLMSSTLLINSSNAFQIQQPMVVTQTNIQYITNNINEINPSDVECKDPCALASMIRTISNNLAGGLIVSAVAADVANKVGQLLLGGFTTELVAEGS